MLEFYPELEARCPASPQELADAAVANCLVGDTSGSGAISEAQFREWLARQGIP
jgi:hypothetical protein